MRGKYKYVVAFIIMGIVAYLFMVIYLPRSYFIRDFKKEGFGVDLSHFNFVYTFEPLSIDPLYEAVVELDKADYNHLIRLKNAFQCQDKINIEYVKYQLANNKTINIGYSKKFLKKFYMALNKVNICLRSKNKYYTYMLFEHKKKYYIYIHYMFYKDR